MARSLTITSLAIVLALLAGLTGEDALAVGTPANTVITNQATANFQVGGVPAAPQNSNPVNNTVDEFLDLVVVNVTPTEPVGQPDTDQVLEFTVTNVGNGAEAVNLTATNLAGDDFDAANVRIYIDDDGTPGFSAGDSLFNAGAPPVLDANTPGNESITVFIVSDIAAAPPALNDTDVASMDLAAASVTEINAGTPATREPLGTTGNGVGDGGVDLVVGDPGNDNASGDYVVTIINVQLLKSALVVSDPFGNAPPTVIPGSVIRYTVQVDVVGTGTVDSLVISDDIPNDVTYNPGTIFLDAVLQTDAAPPGDQGEFVSPPAGVNSNGQVRVDLGNGVASGSSFTITFEVTVD